MIDEDRRPFPESLTRFLPEHRDAATPEAQFRAWLDAQDIEPRGRSLRPVSRWYRLAVLAVSSALWFLMAWTLIRPVWPW